MWRGQGTVYLAIEFIEPVMLNFEHPELGESATIGPLLSMRIINGAIWDMQQPPKLIARFEDAAEVWHIYERPTTSMPKLAIRPAK
jgi:hypothetical protein